MTRSTQDNIHILVQREDGRVEVEETTPRYVCEVEPEDEPEDEGPSSFTPGTDGQPGVIRLGGG